MRLTQLERRIFSSALLVVLLSAVCSCGYFRSKRDDDDKEVVRKYSLRKRTLGPVYDFESSGSTYGSRGGRR